MRLKNDNDDENDEASVKTWHQRRTWTNWTN